MSQSTSNFMGIPVAEGRWEGVVRPYSEADVRKLQGSVRVEHTLARMGAEKFWELLHTEKYIPALGALSGNQVRARPKPSRRRPCRRPRRRGQLALGCALMPGPPILTSLLLSSAPLRRPCRWPRPA